MPTITEAIKGEKITVGAEFFNRMATPIGMAIFSSYRCLRIIIMENNESS